MRKRSTLGGRLIAFGVSASALAAPLSGCAGSAAGPAANRIPGQTSFTSAPMGGSWGIGGGSTLSSGGAGGVSNGGGAPAPTPPTAGPAGASSAPSRAVQETDLYAVEGDRLYYLNSYRGLMVFDISKPDAPILLGRSAVFGDPQTMIVRNGIAVLVIGDWYGRDANGRPFHGSVLRGLDATDPSNIKPVGEVQVPGYVQDTRVVGDVLYAVSVDYGWDYGFYFGGGMYGGGGVSVGGVSGGGGGAPSSVSVVSASFTGGVVAQKGAQSFKGDGVVFNVTANSVMLGITSYATSSTALTYVDISDPAGAIVTRGAYTIPGTIGNWGPDNGRWNLDFADGATAHALSYNNGSYTLSTVSFTNAGAPSQLSEVNVSIPTNYGAPAALFDGSRLFLSSSGYSYGGQSNTPLEVYDLSNGAAPKLVSQTSLPGTVLLFKSDGARIFSVGTTYGSDASLVTINDIDITTPSQPTVLGSASFGSGWGWTPAAQTFKALTLNDQVPGLSNQGLAIVPFSSWNNSNNGYLNGVELVSYTDAGITGSATAATKGYVQRGIFVGNRLYSMSDLALAVIDYSSPSAPVVTNEVTLARNIVSAVPQGATIAELSSDWWWNDVTTSQMRVLPVASAAETTDNGTVPTANITGVGAQSFQNGSFTYVTTSVRTTVPCSKWYGPSSQGTCDGWTQRVTVVDTSNGGAVVRGTIDLPALHDGWAQSYWGGFYWDDWYMGGDVVQVGGDALAFSRWYPQWAPNGAGGYTYVDDLDALFVVDLSNPDAPKLASTRIIDDTSAWWGNMLAVGNELYATHFEWVERPTPNGSSGQEWYVRYFLDRVDLTDRAHPKVGSKVNIPGILVGGSSKNPNTLYTVDYRWDGNSNPVNELQAIRLNGGLAELQSSTPLAGWVGNVFVQDDIAYTTVQQYGWELNSSGAYTPPFTELHQIDFANPSAPKDRVATDRKLGFGWLLGVAGDRALVTSGWGNTGIDIYKLSPDAAPTFDQFARTLGWGPNAVTRQGDTLFLASGYWGVQPIVLK